MVIFLLGEERAYLSWLAHHRRGFVLDWLRKPTRKKPTVHRAACEQIKSSPSQKSHWTTGRHIKVCSLALEELVAWAKEESGADPQYCGVCKPAQRRAASPRGRRLTKLGSEIVDFVVEAAVIHLDRQDSGYRMTVADIAACLDKTPAQITSALLRLAEDGYLRIDKQAAGKASLPGECEVFPTSIALRTLPAFENMPRRQVEAELENLTQEQ